MKKAPFKATYRRPQNITYPHCYVCKLPGFGQISTVKGTYTLCESHFWSNYKRLFKIEYPPELIRQFEEYEIEQKRLKEERKTNKNQGKLI